MTKNDCKCQRQVFVYVAAGDIDSDRPSRTVKTALPGTRSLQAVKSMHPRECYSKNAKSATENHFRLLESWQYNRPAGIPSPDGQPPAQLRRPDHWSLHQPRAIQDATLIVPH